MRRIVLCSMALLAVVRSAGTAAPVCADVVQGKPAGDPNTAVTEHRDGDTLGGHGCATICGPSLPTGCVRASAAEYLELYGADFLFKKMLARAEGFGFSTELLCPVRCTSDTSTVYGAQLADTRNRRALLLRSRGDIHDPYGSVLMGARGERVDLMFGTWTLRFEPSGADGPVKFLDETGKVLSENLGRSPDVRGTAEALRDFSRLCR
jgi:hypothetical protein